jgi:hypothetical protein
MIISLYSADLLRLNDRKAGRIGLRPLGHLRVPTIGLAQSPRGPISRSGRVGEIAGKVGAHLSAASCDFAHPTI